MNHLIVFYSPLEDSFTRKIAIKLSNILLEKKYSVVIRDLRGLGFNPVTTEEEIKLSKDGKYLEDVLLEQDFIRNAEELHLVYPIYQLAMPSVMKGYIDRVFTQGFSYSYDENWNVIPHMVGKSISIYSPMGASMEYAASEGNIGVMDHIIKQTFGFRGFGIKRIKYFDANERDEKLDKLDVD